MPLVAFRFREIEVFSFVSAFAFAAPINVEYGKPCSGERDLKFVISVPVAQARMQQYHRWILLRSALRRAQVTVNLPTVFSLKSNFSQSPCGQQLCGHPCADRFM